MLILNAVFAHLVKPPKISFVDDDTGFNIDDFIYISPADVTLKSIGGDKIISGWIIIGGDGGEIGKAKPVFEDLAIDALMIWVKYIAAETLIKSEVISGVILNAESTNCY